MSTDTVWVSPALQHPKTIRPLRHDLAERDRGRSLSVPTKLRNGIPLDDEDFPTAIWFERPPSSGLSDFFFAYSYWIVSAAAARAFEHCGLGQGELRPVPITEPDRTTPVDGEWRCWSVGNAKHAFLPDASRNIMDMNNDWIPPFVTKDDDIAVASTALEGEALWVDPHLHNAFFMTGRVVKALKQAKATRGFMLKRCRVLA